MALMKTVKSTVETTAPKEVQKASKEEEKRLNVKLPASKHERFRLVCMTNHTTMTEAIESFIDEYLSKHSS